MVATTTAGDSSAALWRDAAAEDDDDIAAGNDPASASVAAGSEASWTTVRQDTPPYVRHVPQYHGRGSSAYCSSAYCLPGIVS